MCSTSTAGSKISAETLSRSALGGADPDRCTAPEGGCACAIPFKVLEEPVVSPGGQSGDALRVLPKRNCGRKGPPRRLMQVGPPNCLQHGDFELSHTSESGRGDSWDIPTTRGLTLDRGVKLAAGKGNGAGGIAVAIRCAFALGSLLFTRCAGAESPAGRQFLLVAGSGADGASVLGVHKSLRSTWPGGG